MCFVDFKKAYDLVWQKGLFAKLEALNINGSFLDLLNIFYKNASYSVKIGNKMTKLFNCDRRVRQGCSLSPILFNLFLNDLLNILDRANSDPVSSSNLCHVSCLMYADDVVIISKSPPGLQNCLDASHDYCQDWELNVNLKKTKAMVFSNKLRKNNKLSFTFNNKALETVSQFTYIGVTIKSTGSFLPNHSSLSINVERAIFVLNNRLRT